MRAQASLKQRPVRHDVVTAVVRFDSTIRTIIDGRKMGFCKLVVDRKAAKILGCHVVGERAVEIVQVAAIAISAGMRVDDLARVPLAFPTYTGNLAYAAADAALQQPKWTAIISPNCERRRKPFCNERIGTTHSAGRKH
jgi:pyridine nucleotide-disulfide oxidoreductase